jgi:ATP-dependent DNA ligase
LSRNEKDLGKKFPEILDSIAALDVQEAIIDGELWHWTTKAVRPFSYCRDSTWAW